MATLRCPTAGCPYTTVDPSALIDHRRNIHGVTVDPSNYLDPDDGAARVAVPAHPKPHPRDSQDPLERIAWMVNQLRIMAWVWLVLTLIGAVFWLLVYFDALIDGT